jgi:guanylate kinase
MSENLITYEREINPLLIVISGPSGVGKDVVVKSLRSQAPQIHFVVTATTRTPRPGEIHGQDYIFVTVEEFIRLIQADELIEHAIVYDQYKGIPKDQVRQAFASHNDVVMRLDVQGAATIKKMIPGAVLIFLMPESEQELINRLSSRHTEPEDQLALRLANAKKEMGNIDFFDYLVVNRNQKLDETVEQILAIMAAEKCRVHQRVVQL